MTDLQHSARTLLEREDVALVDLWISYWNHGGRCHPFAFDALIHEVLISHELDMEALAAAINELSLETAG
ncbi:MAG: hypothetical protein ACLGIS_13410 [Actinomycetes bacterium]